MDPLSQQLVHYREQVVPGSAGSATLPAAVNWTSSTQDTSVYGMIMRVGNDLEYSIADVCICFQLGNLILKTRHLRLRCR